MKNPGLVLFFVKVFCKCAYNDCMNLNALALAEMKIPWQSTHRIHSPNKAQGSGDRLIKPLNLLSHIADNF